MQTSLAVGTVAALGGLAIYANWRLAQGPEPADGWWPIAWPFPRDGWPPGRAWRGHDLEVYVRPKLGFCGNCDTGVVTDEEVDRVTDVDLLDQRFAPVNEGSFARIGALPGRSRLYRYGTSTPHHAEGIAVSQKCDLQRRLQEGPGAVQNRNRKISSEDECPHRTKELTSFPGNGGVID